MQTIRGFIDWMFRSRITGRITLIQSPNAPLVVWLLATVTSRLRVVEGRFADILGVLGAVALALWAVGEIVGGVNPFRRLLGCVVLVWMVGARLGFG